MKTRFTIDLKVFTLILKELRAIKRELQQAQGNAKASKAQPAREVSDKIYSQDVMKRLKITSATLIQYEKKGYLKYHKEGRNKVYSEAEVMGFKKLRAGRKRLGRNFKLPQ